MQHEELTLLELNALVREVIELNLEKTYRVKAELSEVRLSAKGHCFIELTQRDEHSNTPVAKARGVIMAHVFRLIRMDFEETTGQTLCAGLQVLLDVQPQFSEVYGYSLVVTDIDPTYTLGDMARKRKEIISRLEREGVKDLNRSLTLPQLVQNIAIISSATAAGYGDFCHQLDNNPRRYRFNHRLFHAVMQGEDTEKSVIDALNRIMADESCQWDVVVIIRGGGAVSDLNGFETYNLANNCAQYPLPIITGIGHERDTTVLDYVANVHLKTPTAVAAFLIERMDNNAERLHDLFATIAEASSHRMQTEQFKLNSLSSAVQYTVQNFRTRREMKLDNLFQRLCQQTVQRIEMCSVIIEAKATQLRQRYEVRFNTENHRLNLLEQAVRMNDPERILSRGYSVTRKDGKSVRNAAQLKAGDRVTTQFADGEITSVVE